jgi:exosortase/archaeosortase family protein
MLQKFRFAETYKQFSPDQKSFLRNALIAVLVWLPLADVNLIHNVLVKSLAVYAANIIEWISGTSPVTYSTTEQLTDYCIWYVADARGKVLIGSSCDGWELYYLAAAFILIFPRIHWKRKLLFALMAIAVLYVSNLWRVVGLFYIAKSHPDWFAVFHKTIFQFVIYLIMFVIWIIYLRGNKSEPKSTA